MRSPAADVRTGPGWLRTPAVVRLSAAVMRNAGCSRVSARRVSAADIQPQTADTAADACPLLQEAVACPATASRVQPPPIGRGDLLSEPVAELSAHVGHGRPLQRQRLLGGQPA
jgi:hypothetical protein